MSLICDDLILEECKNDIYIFRGYKEEMCYIIKYYGCVNYEEIISRYRKLENIGAIPVFMGVGNSIVVYEAINECYNYHSLNKFDLLDGEVVKNIAVWYKKIKGVLGCDFDGLLTKDKVCKIAVKYNLKYSETFAYIYNNFDNIKLKIERFVTPILISGFSLHTLNVFGSSRDVFSLDFDELKVSDRYNCISEILNGLSDKNKRIFLEEYGDVSEGEMIASYIYNILFKMLLLDVNDKEGNFCLKEVSCGNLLEMCKRLVDCY